jgi:4-phytase/acid phosphatase
MASRIPMRPHILAAAILSAALMAGDVAAAADLALVSTVVVSRHGVRSPIGGHPPLAAYAADPWPSWPVPSGHLTPRGAELAKLLGAYYRKYYVARGLFGTEGCPAPGAVSAWADVDQRTLVTAQSLLDGMFPNCNLAPSSLRDAKVDPLFHPTRAGVCRVDPDEASRAVISRAGGSLASLQRSLQPQIAAMQSVLKCCQPVLCQQDGATASCSLNDLRSEIVKEESGNVRLSGPISIASTASEVFLLEYAEGLPDHQVAWGRVSSAEAIRSLMPLHIVQFDLMQRTPYLAVRQGSALVDRIVLALQRAAETGGADGPKLTLLVGHDTNLANIGGMLGLHWSLPSYLTDATPPAGAMHFELLRDRETNAYAVRISYVAQTLDQMRRGAPLDLADPPATAAADIEGCKGKGGADGTCPWSDFATLANGAIDRACVAPREKSP